MRRDSLAALAALTLALAALAGLLGCGSDAQPGATPPGPCGHGEYEAVLVLDAVHGAEGVLVNGFPVHTTRGPGSMMAPGSEVARVATAALVSGRNEASFVVSPAIVAPGTGAPTVGPVRFRAWVCGPDGDVIAGDPHSTAASDSAFVAWRHAFLARWPGWAAAGDSAVAADPTLRDSLAALVASDPSWAAVGVGPALDSARAWAAAHPVRVEAGFVRPGGASPTDGQPSFDAVFRDAPAIRGTAADSARLRAYAARLLRLNADRDTAALWGAFSGKYADEFLWWGGREGVGEDSAAFMAGARSRVVMDALEPFDIDAVGLRSWSGGRVWELYRKPDDEPLLASPWVGSGRMFREVFVAEVDGRLRVVR